jgi:hypothetical protein
MRRRLSAIPELKPTKEIDMHYQLRITAAVLIGLGIHLSAAALTEREQEGIAQSDAILMKKAAALRLAPAAVAPASAPASVPYNPGRGTVSEKPGERAEYLRTQEGIKQSDEILRKKAQAIREQK